MLRLSLLQCSRYICSNTWWKTAPFVVLSPSRAEPIVLSTVWPVCLFAHSLLVHTLGTRSSLQELEMKPAGASKSVCCFLTGHLRLAQEQSPSNHNLCSSMQIMRTETFPSWLCVGHVAHQCLPLKHSAAWTEANSLLKAQLCSRIKLVLCLEQNPLKVSRAYFFINAKCIKVTFKNNLIWSHNWFTFWDFITLSDRWMPPAVYQVYSSLSHSLYFTSWLCFLLCFFLASIWRIILLALHFLTIRPKTADEEETRCFQFSCRWSSPAAHPLSGSFKDSQSGSIHYFDNLMLSMKSHQH